MNLTGKQNKRSSLKTLELGGWGWEEVQMQMSGTVMSTCDMQKASEAGQCVVADPATAPIPTLLPSTSQDYARFTFVLTFIQWE